jgi:hypothetical protein
MRRVDGPGGKGATARRRLTAKPVFSRAVAPSRSIRSRARMVRHPRDDAWSSGNAHARGAMDPLLGGHALFDGLGANTVDRRKPYWELFRTAGDADFADALRAATNGGSALGDALQAADRQRSSSAFPKFESYQFVATINKNRHSGPALRPAIAGRSTSPMRNCASENDERWIVSHRIDFMKSLV